MLKSILAVALTLAAITANAQTTTPGYDRPAANPTHQHVVYWNDSFDHYSMSMQVAADAYSITDFKDKEDKKKAKMYPHHKQVHK